MVDRFRIDRRSAKRIFVDKTLVKINGQEYWLWIAYEPSMNKCLAMHLSRQNYSRMLPVLSESAIDSAGNQYSQMVVYGTA
jgi:transposase-like protein